jgi:hypothetical protein
MNVLVSTLTEELATVKRLEQKYRRELRALPEGSFVVRRVRGGKYVYSNKREGLKVLQKYIGRATEELVKACERAAMRKRELKEKLKSIREQKKILERALRGKAK